MHDGIPSAPSSAKGRPLVIWTRSTDDLTADLPLLNQHQIDIIHVPCIRIESLATGIADLKASLTDSHWIVVTSQNAIRILTNAARSDAQLQESLAKAERVLTHGRQTAAAAKELFGSRVKSIEAPTSLELTERLKEMVAQESEPPHIIWPGGEEFAFDLTGALQKAGCKAERFNLYRTIAAPTDAQGHQLEGPMRMEQAKLIAQRAHRSKCVVCFASPSAVTGWLALTTAEPDLHPRGLVAAVIGPTTARAATTAGFGNIAVCAWPNLQDLISLGASCAQAHN